MSDTGPTFDPGLDDPIDPIDPIDPPRRRRGAPKGNLNAFKHGGHSRAAHVPYEVLPFTPLRDLLRWAVIFATREEIAALPARPTSAERREATRRGALRVLDCLRTIDLTVPRNPGRMALAFMRALQPILGPEYDRRMEKKLAQNKEQFTSLADWIENDSDDAPLPPDDAGEDPATLAWSPPPVTKKFYRRPNRRGLIDRLPPGLP